MNSLAEELNNEIRQINPYVFEMFSELGKKLFFPKGILSQTAEAKEKASKHNATIGIAKEGSCAMYLPCVIDFVNGLDSDDVVTYTSSFGKAELRKRWLQEMAKKNPALGGKTTSLPVVTSALTHGLSIVGEMFVDSGDVIVVPDKFWGNYKLIFSVRKKAEIRTYPLFSDGGFNIKGLKDTATKASNKGKVIILFNFPNNPTGYSIRRKEGLAIVDVIRKIAKSGCNVVAVFDDAYFGLFYEDEAMKESLFAYFADLSPRVLAIKLDGVTKEDYAWGLRVGFITYSVGDGNRRLYQALEKKTAGVVRGTISNACHLSQSIIVKAMDTPAYNQQRQQKYEVMRRRAQKVEEILRSPKYDACWQAYPFNSGYFMCLRLRHVDAEELRKYLLSKYGVGVISIGRTDVRIAFSCIEEHEIEDLFETIFKAAKELKEKT